MKTSWNLMYPYTFTWLGRPIIQHPEDMFRLQEVIFNLEPDFIIETGISHGGALIFYANILQAIGHGKAIGIEINLRESNREAIENHRLKPYITLIEGNSISPNTVQQATKDIKSTDKVLIVLDSNHSREHVTNELNLYHEYISVNSYIVVTDGIMQDCYDAPRGKEKWQTDNPVTAVEEFLQNHPEFILEQPKWQFNESPLDKNITAWPKAWLKRIGCTKETISEKT